MRKNKILGCVRVDTDLYNQMIKSLEELNSNSITEFRLEDLRRMAYKLLCERILTLKDFSFILRIKK